MSLRRGLVPWRGFSPLGLDAGEEAWSIVEGRRRGSDGGRPGPPFQPVRCHFAFALKVKIMFQQDKIVVHVERDLMKNNDFFFFLQHPAFKTPRQGPVCGGTLTSTTPRGCITNSPVRSSARFTSEDTWIFIAVERLGQFNSENFNQKQSGLKKSP